MQCLLRRLLEMGKIAHENAARRTIDCRESRSMTAARMAMQSSRPTRVIDHLRRTVLLHDEAVLTDGQLLERYLRQRDQTAFAGLLHRHAPMVWAVCRRILAHHQDAEDAFQATFLVLARKAQSVKPPDLVGNWLYGVAQRVASSARTGLTRRRHKEKQGMALPDPPAAAPDDITRELESLLDAELSRLPQKYRVAIVLCDLGGRTRAEAARLLGVPEGTLSGRLSRGRALLAKRLARHGLPVTGGVLAAALARPATAAPSAVVAAAIEATTSGTAGAVSARVAVLVEGVLKAMLLTKLKITAAMVLAIAVLGAGVGWLGVPTFADEQGGAQVPAPEQPQKPKEVVPQKALGDFFVFKLKHADAGRLARTLSELLDGKEMAQVRIVADPASNSLLVRGRREQVELVEALITRLDEAETDQERPPPNPKNPPPEPAVDTSFFALKYSQAVDMAKTLQELLQGKDANALRIAADPQSNSVVARGRSEQLRQVADLVERLEGAAQQRRLRQEDDNERLRRTLGANLLLNEPKAPHAPVTVSIRKGKLEEKAADGLMMLLEGLSLAVLGTCSVESAATKQQWNDALRGDHIHIVYEVVRQVSISTAIGGKLMAASEILVPISADDGPGRILVRSGQAYIGLTKHQTREAQLLRDRFREIE
jgi:RNA polymerase sigma factor (sigma-70 family)